MSYGPRAVVEGFDLAVETGNWIALVGPNGAGKTTVLRSIVGLVDFTGTITVGDTPVAGTGRRELARVVGYVPQRPTLPAGATVTDYVMMGRNPHIASFAMETSADVAIVGDVIDRLELRAYAHRDVGTLSGGEAQRAVLARALAQQAPLLLLDEPTSELDIGRQQHVLELVDELRREAALTVVSTMHDLTLAGLYAERFVLMRGGRIVARGAPDDVLREELIRTCYGADVDVVTSNGRPVVVPRRRSREEVAQRA